MLKFLSSYASDETVYLLTELVSPVEVVIKNLGHDEAIKGLRGIARGLQFLHEKVHISFCSERIFVCDLYDYICHKIPRTEGFYGFSNCYAL